jgi:pimeloyl-ACP methyl ester carboxylesterase
LITVRSQNVDLAVFETGNPEGPTLVLVHGWPDTHALWMHVVPLLEDKFRIVSYDSRGAGQSTTPPRRSDFTLDKLAADFYAVVDAVSPDDPVHVLAHDWGGVEVWEAAAEPRAVQRIRSYTSVSGPNLDHLGKWSRARLKRPTPHNLAQVFAQVRASWYTVTFHIPPLARWRAKRYFRKGWANFLQTFSDVDPSRVEMSPTLLADALNGGALYRANLIPRLTRPRERYVDIPVQLIVNTRDVAVRPFHYDDTGLWVKDLRRTDIDAGHWSPLSHPEDLARLTTEFVESVEARATQSR